MLLFTPRLPSLATRDCENKSLFSVSSHPVKTKKNIFFFISFLFLKESLARATRRLNFQGRLMSGCWDRQVPLSEWEETGLKEVGVGVECSGKKWGVGEGVLWKVGL